MFKGTFWFFIFICVVLGFVGANPPEGMWLVVGRLATAWYFLHFLVILPVLSVVERPKPLPTSISEAVLGGGHTAAGATSKPMEKA
jgi:ubiquinol-cytochrome c reductase cytochrome b subunit